MAFVWIPKHFEEISLHKKNLILNIPEWDELDISEEKENNTPFKF